MAKVCGVIVGLCCLFSLIIGNCNSHETQNLDNYIYDTNAPASNTLNVHEIHIRTKRQLNQTLKPANNITDIATRSNETNANQPPDQETGGGGGGGGGDATNPNKDSIRLTPILGDKHLLGVNGSGQRHDVEPPPEKVQLTQIANGTQSERSGIQILFPDGGPTVKPNKLNNTEYLPGDIIDDMIDIPDNETNIEAAKNNITKFKEDYYQYYNSTIGVDPERVKQYWDEIKNHSVNSLLSKSHRRAITVQLSFDFPFYGHPVRNITVATGGFLYTGEYVHSWLAATQYIAPLMANFDTSISNDSFVRFNDNGTAFTVLWENVSLQDKQGYGRFTFSVSLFKSGDITFVYYGLPISIEQILDDKHPVKIGLSDAYIIDKTIFFARRKTIYEYHRVNFDSQDIKNNTIITLTAEPTCLQFTDCQKCVEMLAPTFKCSWCPTLNKCSTGTDRKRQEWLQKGCDRTQITNASQCAPIGDKGNNYGQLQEIEIKDDVLHSGEKWLHNTDLSAPAKDNSNDVTHIKTAQPLSHEESSGVGLVVGLFIPILLIFTLTLWIFYAYRNPHTKSGQLLIQYRPSQWTWRRGEARYTAATIHM